ncbi:SagB family peptide dehydrogenase [Luteipulveratus mongoliensis]|uniref:SagB family peptide dehydrogenase n=1 Tax=Luteipulveratus mongoliensis TaxID=571913 RepID=UPI0006978176|nr:SagB family peptide dehydrogenase [Luteipulveratus mongoliensis]
MSSSEVVELLALAGGTSLAAVGEGGYELRHRGGQFPLRASNPGVRVALEALSVGPREVGDLTVAVERAGSVAGLLQWNALLDRLDRAGAIDRQLVVDGAPLLTVHVVGSGSSQLMRLPDDLGAVRLSRLATLTALDGRVRAKAPTSAVELHLSDRALKMWGELAQNADVVTAQADSPVWTWFVRALLTAQVATAAKDDDTERWWSPAEWAMHTQSRDPRTVAGFAGTYRFAGVVEAPPAALRTQPLRSLALSVPDLEAARRSDPPLAEVMESRRSRRVHDDDRPITADQLGELLYRIARIRRQFTASDGQELLDRPVPSGGSIHEIDVFPLVGLCDGIEPGLWHYDGAAHQLDLIAEQDPRTEQLRESAASASLMPDGQRPQVVLLLGARFDRLMYKYESIGYSLICKHVGVMFQSVYLAAESMGLATCALGAGLSPVFNDVSGFDPFSLSTVGEITVGSRGAEPDGSS